ncbi:hypothetical protein C8R48DRAFT_405472 [Suillus tomentosus]|nr:hypothetical protein C8R48DRAFT_405472 [Suillus tomentosus]
MNIGECILILIFLTCPCSGSVGLAHLMQILEQKLILNQRGENHIDLYAISSPISSFAMGLVAATPCKPISHGSVSELWSVRALPGPVLVIAQAECSPPCSYGTT